MPHPKVAVEVLVEEVPIVEGVEVSVEGDVIRVKGPLGELSRKYDSRMVDVEADPEEKKVILRTYNPRKFQRAYIGTVAAHIKNMMKGVTEGFRKEMIVVYAHFPIKVEVDEERRLVLIHNFLGERSPRVAKIVGDVKVTVEGDRIHIEGISKEDVGQTAANIRQATRIKRKDPRVFMDGIYVLEE
ncbi:MAG: 50S ribosomal protein L6 [Candidatus Korarchaeota archaeon]|nr:50S ribosomal protein L6 [Candidatus Korarchaeota archaeon]